MLISMLPETPRHERPRWEPEPLHIPAPEPVRPQDRGRAPESEAPSERRVVVIDLV